MVVPPRDREHVRDTLPDGWENAPFGSIELFYPQPLGVGTIGKIVPKWCAALGMKADRLNSKGERKGYKNSSVRHLLAQTLRENDCDEKLRMNAGMYMQHSYRFWL